MLVSEVLACMYLAGVFACFIELYRLGRFKVMLPGLTPDDWLCTLGTLCARLSVSTYWIIFMLIEAVHYSRTRGN